MNERDAMMAVGGALGVCAIVVVALVVAQVMPHDPVAVRAVAPATATRVLPSVEVRAAAANAGYAAEARTFALEGESTRWLVIGRAPAFVVYVSFEGGDWQPAWSSVPGAPATMPERLLRSIEPPR